VIYKLPLFTLGLILSIKTGNLRLLSIIIGVTLGEEELVEAQQLRLFHKRCNIHLCTMFWRRVYLVGLL